MSPKLSIGLPIYNEDYKLESTINNLLNQSYQNFEIIISNNLSNDNTRNICEKFKDRRIKLFHQSKKLSSFDNFNFTFSNSVGEYFLWNSGHDHRSKNFFINCIDFLETNKDYVACCADFRSNIKDTKNLFNYYSFEKMNNKERLNFFKNIKYNYFIYSVFRSNSIRNSSMLSNVVGSDELFIYEMSFLGKLKRLNSGNEYTYMYIDNKQSGNWEIYNKKHLLKKKINVFFTFFKKIKIFNKILKKQKIIFFEKIHYNFFFIVKEIRAIIKLIYYSSIRILK